MSACRGGLHGEGHKVSSHDKGTKKNNGEDFQIADEVSDREVEDNEVQDTWSTQGDQVVEERQSQQSTQIIDEINRKETEWSIMDTPVTSPKATAAKALGAMLNDARVTNVLMVILVLVGMGGAEFAQTQMCNL